MNNTYDSKYSIAIEINLKLGNEPKNFDGTYSICMDIYNKLGGDKTSFDSIYSILESIMQLIDAEHTNKFDSIYSQCLSIYNKLGGEPKLFDSTYSILLGILPLVEPGPAPVPVPNDEIWYTTTDDNKYDLDGIIRTLVATGATYNGPAVVSNEYDEEKQMYCMSFDDDITILGDLNTGTMTAEGPFFITNQLYGLVCNVETIILPKTITRIGD